MKDERLYRYEILITNGSQTLMRILSDKINVMNGDVIYIHNPASFNNGHLTEAGIHMQVPMHMSIVTERKIDENKA